MITLSRAAPRITGLVLLNEFPETPTSGFPDSGELIEPRRSIEDVESARTQTPARRALEWWYRRRLAPPAYDRAGLDGGKIAKRFAMLRVGRETRFGPLRWKEVATT